MDETALAAIAAAILGGGGLASVGSLYLARKRAPADVESVVVQTAETAVLTLERSLQAETRRADRAEAEAGELRIRLDEKDERIAALEKRLDTLQAALDDARDELHAIIVGSRDDTK